MRHLSIVLSSTLAVPALLASEPLVVPIWNGVPPGSEGQNGEEVVRIFETGERIVSNVHRPSITVYTPANAEDATAAVLILPGGGHRELWSDHEGHNIGRWLSERGVAGFVLKYRLSMDEGSPYSIADEVADAKRAVRFIRSRAAEWNIDPGRLGIMGFSAGGETAARAVMQSDDGDPAATDVVERETSPLALQALVYPGNSSVIQPESGAPPVFLCWGYYDRPDIADGLGELYARFRKAGVLVEMHEYSDANHGFGLRAQDSSPAGKWIERFHEWLGGRGLLTPVQQESPGETPGG
jgi:acetyl esterase/lipase